MGRYSNGWIAILALAAAAATAQPKITMLEGSTFDLGSLYRGSVAERTLTIKNVGSEELVLGRVEASCGCTGAVVSNDHIPPGKTGKLQITFNSKNFTGAVHKTVTVSSNDPETPRALVEFTAMIIDEIVVAPPQFWFKDAEVGRVSSVTITVRNGGNEPLRLTGFRTQLAGMTITLPTNPIEAGKTGQVTATFKPPAAVPIVSDGVFLTTTNPRQPEVFVPIYGNAKEFKFN
jgi:hypothetical protein